MSEQLQNHNQGRQSEVLANSEVDALKEKLMNEARENAEKAEDNRPNAEALSRRVEQAAISGKEMSVGERSDNRQHPVLINKQLKDMAYSRAMVRVRKHLSPVSSGFSRIVHAKPVEAVSEVASKTIARPSGLLGGALLSAIGSSLLLWITKHNGYEYNYLAAISLFGIGIVVGILVEFGFKTFKKSH